MEVGLPGAAPCHNLLLSNASRLLMLEYTSCQASGLAIEISSGAIRTISPYLRYSCRTSLARWPHHSERTYAKLVDVQSLGPGNLARGWKPVL
jgi:hypothetical protein